MNNNLKKIILLFFMLILLFSLASCKDKECKENQDCFKKGFTGTCIDYKCKYNPLPNFCGNMLCEENENKCTCPIDCGSCSGKLLGSKDLEMFCIQNECIAKIPENKIKKITFDKEIKNGGDTFAVNLLLNQPFNIKKDLFNINILLKTQNKNNKEELIKNIEINAKTSDRRTITLARKQINKYLWKEGNEINERIILDFPSLKIEDELTDLEIKINYDYILKSTRDETKKSTSLKIRLTNLKFSYVAPNFIYPCPESCDDNNPATRDYCDVETHFCNHEPIINTCGNYICETGENKCTCPIDCGYCEGFVGEFLELKCVENKCVADATNVNIEKNSILDERNIGAIKLINNYNYNKPFDVNKDKFELKFSMYVLPEGTTGFKIDTIRVLSGTEELGKIDSNKIVKSTDTKIAVGVKEISGFEKSKTVTLKIWYSYNKNGKTEKGTYSKTLGKISFINPK